MKQSRNRQVQRKTQSWLALLIYRLAQGPVETGPLAALAQQICSERIAANPINANALNNPQAPAQLGKLLKTSRLKRKLVHFMRLRNQNEKEQKQPTDYPPLTIGDIVTGWARLTSQDKTEFALKVCPKINKLLSERYKTIGYVGITDSQAYDDPESASNFIVDLLNIFIEETPVDNKDSLVEQMKATLITLSTQSAVEVDSELLHDASTMLTSEIATEISGALSDNPSAKARLLNPVFGELLALEAKKYGWDSGVPADNHARLQSDLSQNGVSHLKRIISRSLKKLGRKNVLKNIDDALDGKLEENLNKIISEQTTIEQNKTQSIWEFSPVSPKDTAETEKRIREWLFRRNKK